MFMIVGFRLYEERLSDVAKPGPSGVAELRPSGVTRLILYSYSN